MTFDETRDNITAMEATIMEADRLAREESAPYPPAYPFPVFGGGPVEDDDDYDDGQPDEYTEWQDYMGGDDWDHGQYEEGESVWDW